MIPLILPTCVSMDAPLPFLLPSIPLSLIGRGTFEDFQEEMELATCRSGGDDRLIEGERQSDRDRAFFPSSFVGAKSSSLYSDNDTAAPRRR